MKTKNKKIPQPLLKSFLDKSFFTHPYFYLILAAAIIALGFLARAYHLSSLPPGVYPDEAVNGTDALNALETGHFRWFYPNNYGREGLFMNLIALGFKFFGANIITLKMWSVFFSTLTILGMILLAREFWNTWRAGLIAGFLYATSYWAINFSRISFRANMLPFVLVFSFYFLFRALRTGKYYDYILAGAFFGLGVHTYIAFRVAPAILVVVLLALIASKKKFFRNFWKPLLIYIVSMFLVALPMLLTFYFHPEYFETRSESVSILSPKVNQGQLSHALWVSLTKTLGMFNFQGDQNWRHNFPGQPELQFFVGIFFLIGIFYLIGRFFHLAWQRGKYGKRSDELVISSLILAWFFVMLLPEMLTYEGLPHSLRAIGTLPAALLIATFAIEKTFAAIGKIHSSSQARRFAKFALYTALIAILVWSGFSSLKRYFVDWAQAPQIHAAFSRNFKNMALYLNSLPSDVHKYVVANAGGQIMEDGLPVSAEVVKFLTYSRTPGIVYLKPDFEANIIQTPAKVVLMYYDGEAIAKVKALFPNAYVQKIDPQPGNGTDYFVININ